MKPKENADDKAARMRERRITDIEQQKAGEKSAATLTSDINSVYGSRLFSLFDRKKSAGAK